MLDLIADVAQQAGLDQRTVRTALWGFVDDQALSVGLDGRVALAAAPACRYTACPHPSQGWHAEAHSA